MLTAARRSFYHESVRRILQRVDPGGHRRAVQPRGLLLRSDPEVASEAEPPLQIEEEEVPREGAQVERSFQHARWSGGANLLWLAPAQDHWSW